MTDRKTYSVRLSPVLMQKIKLQAVKKNKSISDILDEAITNLLRSPKNEK